MTRAPAVLIAVFLVSTCAPASALRPVSPSPIASTAPAPTPTSRTSEPSISVVVGPSPSAKGVYADVSGRLLVQHFGNALDGSERNNSSPDYDKSRFYLMNPDGSGVTELLPGQPTGGKNMADISPDLKKVAFMDWTDPSKLYEVGLDGTGFRTISTPCTCAEADPSYSPDGLRLAFVRITGSSSQVGVRDLASGKVTMLPGTQGKDAGGATSETSEQPAWSPDGRSIVYATMIRDADGHLMSSRIAMVNLASQAVTQLPVPPALSLGEPKFSPDGSLILMASRPGYATKGEAFGDVYTVHPDGTGLTLLTPEEGTGASWTPDGKHILYYALNYIWLMDPDGANKAQWSPSGPDLSTGETGYGYTTYWIPKP